MTFSFLMGLAFFWGNKVKKNASFFKYYIGYEYLGKIIFIDLQNEYNFYLLNTLLVKHNFWIILGLTVLIAIALLIIGLTGGITTQSVLITCVTFATLLVSSQILRYSIISNSVPKLDVSVLRAEELEIDNDAVTFVKAEIRVSNKGLGMALIRDYKLESELMGDAEERYFEKVKPEERGMMSNPGITSKNSPTQIGYGESDIIEVAINGFEYFTNYKLLID